MDVLNTFAFICLIALMLFVYSFLPERPKYNHEGQLLIPEEGQDLSQYTPEELVQIKKFWEEKARKFEGGMQEYCLDRIKEVEKCLQ